MTQEQLQVSRRLVSIPEWTWQVGMLVVEHEMSSTRSRLLYTENGRWNAHEPKSGAWLRYRNTSHLLPDLSDEPTGGILLGILRKSLKGSLTVTPTDREWRISVSVDSMERTYTGSSLAEVCAMVMVSS